MSTAASASTSTAGFTGFHLNRRGRLLFLGIPVLLVAALAAAAAVFFGANSMAPAAASDGAGGTAVESVTVNYGDTLWTIAGRTAPEAPRNETILRIGELNDLNGSELQPGQVLFVPVSSAAN
ncbi:LysM peptidoglycan-binding domain-containing protein [Citricoccus sp. GCM10030269]|uniref:LysM peptidoglycan-binding domain-containing protein n=1 Tax=Citricoccus sp. GCM10030269 TaxID=3273388 RepID=UPI00362060DB